MKFGELLKVNKPELIISKRYDAWVSKNSNPVYTDEALAFGMHQMYMQAKPRDRRGTISASSVYSCMRKQQFTYLGMPEQQFSAKTSAILQNGTFMHIRWQMAGITEGFMPKCEIPVDQNEYGLSGTKDAHAYDGSVIELKSCNSNSYRNVGTFGPLSGHKDQLATYMLLTDTQRGALVYENKDTQEFTELVYDREELPLDGVKQRAHLIWQLIDNKKLAEPLDAAYEEKQPCSTCVFRENCLAVKDWDHAEQFVGER